MIVVDNEKKKRAIRIETRAWANAKKLAELEEKNVEDLAGDLVEEALELEKYQEILKG